MESRPPITLPAPKEGVNALKQALREAIQRASGEPSSGTDGSATSAP